MPTTRSQKASQSLPSRAGRKRSADEADAAPAPAPVPSAPAPGPAKKRAKVVMTTAPLSPEKQYLSDAIREFDEQQGKCCRRAKRREILEISLKYFRKFEMPRAVDAMFPATEDEARQLLASDQPITVPVFVGDGANYSMIDPKGDPRRPVEQLFDFLHDDEETAEYPDQANGRDGVHKKMTVRDIRKRFLAPAEKAKAPERYPRNFRDMVTPMPDAAVPRFLQSAACTLLHDIVRRQTDVDHICECVEGGVTVEGCEHRVLQDEFAELSQMWRFWRGTVMLSEAGGITLPHWDRFGTGTWISCLEGEMGFGWLAKPSKEEELAWLEDVSVPRGRYAFTVLRPGGAVYMPPGTVHYVFRRPGGGQTFGFASQFLRRADALQWLKHMEIEVSFAIRDEIQDAPYRQVVPALLKGLFQLVNAAIRDGKEKAYGGKPVIAEMRAVAENLDAMVEQLKEAQNS